MSRLEVGIRAVLALAVAAAIALALRASIASPLFVVGAAATAELALRPYSRDGAGKVLLICGATMTTLILIGLGLNLTPWGLTRFTWAAGWLVVSGAVLVWRRNLTTSMSVSHMRHSLRRHWIIGLYGVAALAIFVSAGILAMSGVRAWSEKPLLEFSLVSKNSSSVVVKIHAISTEGTYRIVANSTSRDASRYSSSLIMVNADDKGLALNESVPVNVAGRWTIYLNAVSGPGTSRELIVDVAAG